MRLFRRNNHPRNPLPLVRIRKGTGHCIRPPRGEFRRNPVAVLLAQLIGKPLCMGGGVERSVPSSKKSHASEGVAKFLAYRTYPGGIKPMQVRYDGAAFERSDLWISEVSYERDDRWIEVSEAEF